MSRISIRPAIVERTSSHLMFCTRWNPLSSQENDSLSLDRTCIRRSRIIALSNPYLQRMKAGIHRTRAPTPAYRSTPSRPQQPAVPVRQVGQPRPLPAPPHVRGSLSDRGKEERRRLRLCLYCGQKGHLAKNCPSGNRWVVAATQEIKETQESTSDTQEGFPQADLD